MTDKEIVKAKKLLKKLEEAYNAYYDTSKGMPYDLDTTIRETAICLEHSIDEINSQKAEIAEIQKNSETLAIALVKAKAEIERLQQKYELSEAEREANVKGFTENLETVRAEAIKEFAERLKEKSKMPLGTLYGKLVYLTDIDNLVKEMTEDEG